LNNPVWLLTGRGSFYHSVKRTTDLKRIKPILTAACAIIILFVAVSLLDVVISVLYARFYSSIAFIVTFGVGGIFGAVFAYHYGMEMAVAKDEKDRWSLIILLIAAGLLSFFWLAQMEAGEYAAAFKAYGATLAMGSLLFTYGKID